MAVAVHHNRLEHTPLSGVMEAPGASILAPFASGLRGPRCNTVYGYDPWQLCQSYWHGGEDSERPLCVAGQGQHRPLALETTDGGDNVAAAIFVMQWSLNYVFFLNFLWNRSPYCLSSSATPQRTAYTAKCHLRWQSI